MNKIKQQHKTSGETRNLFGRMGLVWKGLVILVILLVIGACTALPASLDPSAGQPPAATRPPTRTPIDLPPTWTAPPPAPATPTLTPLPTWTPHPSATPNRAVLPPTATVYPPVLSIADGGFPDLTFDLWYLSSQTLYRLDRAEGEAAPVPDPDTAPGDPDQGIDDVLFYQTRQAGRYILLVQQPAPGQYQLRVWDRQDEIIIYRGLIEESILGDISLAPNVQWLSYQVTPLEPPRDAVGEEAESLVVSVRLDSSRAFADDDQPPAVSAPCYAGCREVTWSVTSDALYWLDARGLWRWALSAVPQPQPAQILPERMNDLSIWSSEGSSARELIYPYTQMTLEGFSPNGRYLALDIPVAGPDGTLNLINGRFILDVTGPAAMKLPGIFTYTDQPDLVSNWLQNGQLLVGRGGARGGLARYPSIEAWQLTANGEVISPTLALSSEAGDRVTQVILAPRQLSGNTIYFIKIDYRSPFYLDEDGIFAGNLETGILRKLQDLPYGTYDGAIWSPDLSGVLLSSRARIIYAPINGSIYDVASLIGRNTCCYSWVR